MLFRRKKKEPDFTSKSGSFAFYFSIPTTYCLTAFLLFEAVLLLQVRGEQKGSSFLFFHAFIAGAILTSSLRAPRLRTLIHELKHAALVILTGNKLQGISIGAGEGHIEYGVYEDSSHLTPFIKLAPYFFPLFSLPIFILGLLLEGDMRTALLYALGFFYGVDLSTGYGEIHSLQTDLKRVYGGFFITRLFIFGAHLLWFSLIFLWVLGGRAAYIFLLESLSATVSIVSPGNS